MAAMERHLVPVVVILVMMSMICGSQGAVMSIDLGNEWIKVAIVSPGKPMEVALNTDSSRKTPLIVAFRNGERHFGEAALTTATRFPEKSYSHLLDVIGKKVDNPIVQTYVQRFPYLNMSADPVKNTVIFNHPEGMSFTPEELLGMIFEKCRSFAEIAAGDGVSSKISEVVITVPPFFTQSERRGILSAAQLAGLKVLQLMNSNTGVALNYGVFRIKDFNETSPTHILFYDLGSSATIASVVSYQVIKSKDKGYIEKTPTLTVAGVGYDRTLGGFQMQLLLRDHLVKKFADQHKIPAQKVTSNHRAMSKLLKEAGRVKKILSANTETNARVENVMDDLDLKVEVTRTDFEALCGDLLAADRLQKPVKDALLMSGLSLSNLDQVILFGGNTRVPKVQEVLSSVVNGKELGKSINSDEAAALGSVYQAAFLSKGFKVKQFTVRDINLFPIQVEFNRNVAATSDGDASDGNKDGGTDTEGINSASAPSKVKSMTRVIFGRGNVYPQKKVLTFNKHVEDFNFYVNYGSDIRKFFSEAEINQIGSLNITKSSVKGVKDAFDKQLASGHDEKKESKGIKAHFKLDESGLLILDSIEATFEFKVEEDADQEKIDSNVVSDTIKNLGKTFSQFFGANAPNLDNLEGNVEINQEKEAPGNETVPDDGQQRSVNNQSTVNVNGTSTTINGSTVPIVNGTLAPKKEIKIKTIKEPLMFESQTLDVLSPDAESINESIKKLKELKKKDEERFKHDSIRNNLESFIAETKMKLHETEFEVATTNSERDLLINELNQASEWLEYESDGAKTEDLQSKLSSLKTSTTSMFERVREHRERPEAVKALNDMLNISNIFLENAKNLSDDQQIFTDVEINSLQVLVTDTSEWLHVSILEQSKTALSAPPVVTIKQIAEKISNLDREVKYLVNKLKITPPKKKPTPAPTTAPTSADGAADNDEQVVDAENEASAEENDSSAENVVDAVASSGQTPTKVGTRSSTSGEGIKDGSGDKDGPSVDTNQEPDLHSKRKKKRRKGSASVDEDKAHSEL